MVVNSGDILRDQTGQILGGDVGSVIMVLKEVEDSDVPKYECISIPQSDEEFNTETYSFEESDLEQLKYLANIHKAFDRI